jgi:hypothetical protein
MAKRTPTRRKAPSPKGKKPTKRFAPPPALSGLISAFKGQKSLAADPKSLNRYERTLPPELAAPVTALKRKYRENHLNFALSRFYKRTKKIPRESLIVIDTEGKRIKSFAKDGALINTKVYMLKVSKKGKVTIFNKIDSDTIRGRRRGKPAPQSVRFFNAKNIPKSSNIYTEYVNMIRRDLQARGTMLTRKALEGITISTNGDLTPFYDQVTTLIKKIAMSEKAAFSFTITGSMFALKGLDDDEGIVIEFQSDYINTQEFTKIVPRGKNIITHDPAMLVRKRLHAAIASALEMNGLVSVSSVRRIRRLAMNKGKSRNNWNVKYSNGSIEKWEGRGMEDALVQEITYKVLPAARSK